MLSVIFFSPVSVSFRISWSDAEEVSADTGANEQSGGSGAENAPDEGGDDSSKDENLNNDGEEGSGEETDAKNTADKMDTEDEEGEETEQSGQSESQEEEQENDGENSGDDLQKDQKTTADEISDQTDQTNEENQTNPTDEKKAGETEGGEASLSASGDGGSGGETGDGGTGGDGAGAGEGGATGDQSAALDAQAQGGTGGDGGNGDMASTTTDVATSTASSTPDEFDPETATETIVTGDAIANADLLNVINTNLVNSYGELLFLSNMFAESVGRVDFRSLSLFGLGGAACLVCTGSSTIDLELMNRSHSSTTNDIDGAAATGGNGVDTSGGGYISTGNAYAAGNIINFINNNIVDSNYLFLTYNNFGDLGGDIVFPNAETFLDIFGQSLSEGLADYFADAANISEADIEDEIDIEAETGGNELLTASGNGVIDTGEASTAVNTLNILNENLIGGGSMNIFFKVHGDWSGKVYGLPPGVTMREADGGFTLSYETLEAVADSGRPRDETIEVGNASTAEIRNEIDLSASTGGNAMAAGEGAIETGDAYAAANVINVANTNMIGRNMFWAIVNIFGDWNGDISFGKPDLWIGGHAEMEGTPLRPGQDIVYHLTVVNNGDTAAEEASLTMDFGSDYLLHDGAEGDLTMELGTLEPGESKSYDITASVAEGMPHVKESVKTAARVHSEQSDENDADNEEEIAFSIDNERSHGGSRRRTVSETRELSAASTTSSFTSDSFTVTKTHGSPDGSVAGGNVDYTIVVYNGSGEALYDVKLADRLTGPDSALVHEEIWNLGTVAAHEEVTLEYSVRFAGDAPAGVYANKARASALRTPGAGSEQVWSNISEASVTILEPPEEPVAVLLAPEEDVATSTEAIGPALVMEAFAAGEGGDSDLVAAAFFATPTGKQLAAITLFLAGLALIVIGIRRRVGEGELS